MPITGGDRRLARLTAGDRRQTRLAAGDRLAPLLTALRGALELPSLGLSGSVSPAVEIGGAFVLDGGLELSGGLSPVVALSGSLPAASLQLAGELSPAVAVGGALAAPSLQLAGAVAPAMALDAGALPLPSVQLAGGVAPAVTLSAALGLPSLGLSGGVSPVVALGGSLALPSLALSGGVLLFDPTQIASLVAHWSGNGSTGASAPNRITGSSVGALEQATPADQPAIITLANGVKALSFDGVDDDMKTPDVAALRFTGPRGYWAWHLRSVDVYAPYQNLAAQWAEGGVTERFHVYFSAAVGTCLLYIPTSATTIATQTHGPVLSQLQSGCFLEVIFDGSLAAAARLKLYADGVLVPVTASGSTIPTALLAGDALNYWVGSSNGASNKRGDIAHHYVGNDIPTDVERSSLRGFEAPLWATTNPYVSPVYCAATTFGSGGSAWPTHMAGDIGVLCVETANEAVSTPAGWTPVTNGDQGVGAVASATATRLQVFWKRAASSAEPTVTLELKINHRIASIATFRGCIASGDPVDVSAGDATADVDSTAVVIPGATTTVPNCLVLAIASRHTDSFAPQQSGEVNASLANLAELLDSGNTSGNGGGIAMVAGTLAAAGAYAATTATISPAARQARVSLALKPNP